VSELFTKLYRHPRFREVLWVFGSVLFAAIAVSLLAIAVPWLQYYTHAVLALVFLFTPQIIFARYDLDPADFGLTTDGALWSTLWGVAFTIATILPFAGGYYVWQTQFLGNSFDVETGNYLQWSPQLKGKPTSWSDNSGVWLWTRNDRLTIRASNTEGRRDFSLILTSSTKLELETGDSIRPASEVMTAGFRYRLDIKDSNTPITLTLNEAEPPHGPPESLRLRIDGESDQHLYLGPTQRDVGQSHSLDRNLNWIWLWFLTQLIVIALPEEYFYRGYLQTRLGECLKQTERSGAIFGISYQNVAASTLFAIGHLAVPINGSILFNRLSVFFPAIAFGWLRERTDNISGAVIYHAGCNMMVLLAEVHVVWN
jgi:hypothetical protein